MDLGKHAVFIWSSYGVAVTVLAALIVYLWLSGRAQKRALAELEARGVRRRSAE
ncbi:MAG: heme exporter protein CcmD [Pseudomonadota bacterium]